MRLSRKQAQALGLDTTPPPKKRTKREPVAPALFLSLCQSHGLPPPEPEFEFCPGRKWRFDWLFRKGRRKVALEVQGGLFIRGRHTQGAALLKEYEKLSEAAILGYRVVFCTPKDIESGAAFALVKRALEERT